MSKKTVIIFMASVCAIAFIIRVVYTYPVVFGMGFVNFTETDAWYKMTMVKQIADMGLSQSIFYMVNSNQLFAWLVSTASAIMPWWNYEVIGAWLPPLVAVGVIIVVYFIGRELFNQIVGIASALFVAIMPSEFLGRSALGFTDHHVMEVLLFCLILLFMIKAVKTERIFSKWVVWAGVSLFLYMINWKSGIYVAGLFIGITLIYFGIYNLANKKDATPAPAVMLLIGIIGLALYLPLGGYHQLVYFIPGQGGQVAAQTTGEIIGTVTEPLGTRTISELMPLLAPAGYFSLNVVISNLNIFIPASLIGLCFLWKFRNDKAVILFVVWSILMFIMTLNERRFLYYSTVSIAVVSAVCVYELAKKLKGRPMQNAIILIVPFLIICLPLGKLISSYNGHMMTQDWHNTLTWLSVQPDKGKVTAWGDYGHWIKYVSGKTPNNLPGPGGIDTAKLYLSEDTAQTKSGLDKLNTGYLIVDDFTLNQLYPVMAMYAGDDPKDKNNTLMFRTYGKYSVPSYLSLKYENTTVKVYEYGGR